MPSGPNWDEFVFGVRDTPTPYAPRDTYRHGGRIADLILAQGQQQADAERQRGETSGQMWQGIGHTVAGSLGQLAQGFEQRDAQRQDAPRLARKAALEDAQFLQIQQQMDLAARQAKTREEAQAWTQAKEKHQHAVMQLAKVLDAPPDQQPTLYGEIRSSIAPDDPEFPAEFPGEQWVKSSLRELLDPKEFLASLQPAKAEPFTLSKGQQRFGPEGKLIASVPESEPRETNPTEAALALRAAQGDAQAKQALALIRQQRPEPQGASGPRENWQWVVRNGKPVHTNQTLSGDEPLRAQLNTGDTAQDRQRQARTTAAKDFLTRLNELRTKINTKMGPSAGLTGMARRGAAKVGLDPDVAEYERIRAAGGRSLAVAIMGAQNLSDADANAWANMLPDARTDEDTAKRLTVQVERMLDGMTGGAANTEAPAAPARGRTRVTGPNGESGTVPAGTALPPGWREAK